MKRIGPNPSLSPMPKTSLTVLPTAPETIDIEPAAPAVDGWQKVRRYAEHAALFQRASLACQIMAGFELIALRDATKRQGKRSDTSSGSRKKLAANTSGSRNNSGEGFLAEVQKLGGISQSTAYEWMEMAKVAKPRLAKGDLDLAVILEKNPGALSPAEQELLKKAVHKISDGRKQMEFLLECGAIKAPQGSAAKGGNTTRALPAAEGEATAPAQPASHLPAGWEDQSVSLNRIVLSALQGHWWKECDQAARRELHGNLIDLAREISDTLKQEPRG